MGSILKFQGRQECFLRNVDLGDALHALLVLLRIVTFCCEDIELPLLFKCWSRYFME